MVESIPADEGWQNARVEKEKGRGRKQRALRKVGFRASEAVKLSNISFKIPYIKTLIRDRRELLRQSLKEKHTMTYFFREVRSLYESIEWLDENGNPDFWAMLQWYKERYKEKDPTWRTPHPKKPVVKKSQEQYAEMLEEHDQKYPSGATYKRKR